MAITKKQLDYWKAQQDKGCPPVSDKAALRMKPVRAIAAVTADNGLGLRMLTDDGDMAEVFLNPVVAEHLLRLIGSAGWKGGWLDGSLNLNVVSDKSGG